VTPVKAVIFDFIGTLTSIKGYNLEDSKRKLCEAIIEAGFDVGDDCFLEAYSQAHEKYRAIRYGELVEVTNAIWISEALNNLGFKTMPEDTRIKTAVNVFFEDYINATELRPCARKTLEKVSTNHKLGLISNYTYAPVIHAGLRKLGISKFFNAILISEEVGWRKPHRRIFEAALERLKVTAEEAVYIGDHPLEDIKGAKDMGMKTVFVPSQFNAHENLVESGQKPDLIVKDICELCKELPKFLDKNIT
jgi:putative hydrolase of the HAD superfamily